MRTKRTRAAQQRDERKRTKLMGDLSEWKTIKEASELLGIAESTIRVQIVNGKIESTKVGARQNLISIREIERYRKEQLRETAEKAEP